MKIVCKIDGAYVIAAPKPGLHKAIELDTDYKFLTEENGIPKVSKDNTNWVLCSEIIEGYKKYPAKAFLMEKLNEKIDEIKNSWKAGFDL